MTITELCKESWEIAEEQGHHEGMPADRTHTILRLALVHTEVSEATQIIKRHGMSSQWQYAFATELADILIRVSEMAYMLGIPLEDVTKRVLCANRDRPYKYGTPEEGTA